jgi:hypothetical protein
MPIVEDNEKPPVPAIAVAYGDGNAPEWMEAVLQILADARVPISISSIDVGAKLYSKGVKNGIHPRVMETLARTRAVLLPPIPTPAEDGFQPVADALVEILALAPLPANGTTRAYASETYALFESQESGVAPLLAAALQLLKHLGLADHAAKIRSAQEAVSL